MFKCFQCKHLSKDRSHLFTDYLKTITDDDRDFYTCKAPHEHVSTWLFGIGRYNRVSPCALNYFEPKDFNTFQVTNISTQLKLF